MTAPRHSAGSWISKGGSNSSWVCCMERVVAVGSGGSRLRPSLSPQTRYCPLADARSAEEVNGLHPLFTEEPPNARTDSDGAQTAVAGWAVSQMPKILLAEDDGDMRRFLAKAL